MFEKLHMLACYIHLIGLFLYIDNIILSFRKGKVKPFDIMKKDTSKKFVELFISMGDSTVDVDIDATLEFVCQMYSQHKTRDVNEARYIKMLEMTGKVDQVS